VASRRPIEIDLAEQRLLPEAEKGQQAAALADFTGDGAQDLVIVLKNGEAWLFPRKVAGGRALSVSVALGKDAPDPLVVVGYAGKRCLGARQDQHDLIPVVNCALVLEQLCILRRAVGIARLRSAKASTIPCNPMQVAFTPRDLRLQCAEKPVHSRNRVSDRGFELLLLDAPQEVPRLEPMPVGL
jgi:hypothetical protein